MSLQAVLGDHLRQLPRFADLPLLSSEPEDAVLAASITAAASKQTYYTVRFLVDADRVADAYRAYAYFRWLDDTLDQGEVLPRRHVFLARQWALVERCLRGDVPGDVTSEESLLVSLLCRDREPGSGLRLYVSHMMSVMAFDAGRRGRLISYQELVAYQRWLAAAVTEALHHFIGHGERAPHSALRYHAATGAHITHMLRDTLEDCAAGYYNIPREFLAAHGILPHDVSSAPYRAWVKSRVDLARACFRTGKHYLAQVENARCRLAGHLYIARFEGTLDAIAREGYCLRAAYPERKSAAAVLRVIGGSSLAMLHLPMWGRGGA